MYEGDSFFTLSTGGQVGLVVLSAVLGGTMIALTWRLARRRRLAVRLAVWAALFLGFTWLSPQVYYLYYIAILDDLPLQWVSPPWPDPAGAVRAVTFRAGDRLADHARGGLGILMLCTALAAALDRGGGASHQSGACGHGRDQ